jgi:pimeloyl-ACP methyl ester carboxylesterase
MRRHTLLTLLTILPTLWATGCQFIALDRELKEMEKFTTIEGSVTEESKSTNPVAIALFAHEMTRQNLVNAKLIEGRHFRFAAPPGKYFLFAFEDKNQDFDYQPKQEAAGYYGNPTPIIVRKNASQRGIRIHLRPDLPLPSRHESRPKDRRKADAFLPQLWQGRKNIGALVSLDDGRFDEGHASTGLWQPLKFSLEYGPGLFQLERHDSAKIPILFVHGINSSPRTWKAIIARLDPSRYQPWVYHYASGLPLHANATYLYEAVTQLKQQYGVDRIFLVAHSMGGLVSQAFINLHPAGTADYLKVFITIATPWGGHTAARLGVKYSPAVVPVWRDMAPSSDMLARIKASKLPGRLPYYLIYGYTGADPTRPDANDGVVSLESQRLPSAIKRAKRAYGFRASHTNILADDRAIGLVLDLLQQAS